jgi:hypothetical protein
VWLGRAFGAIGARTGEICFNTRLTGYQETLTDPSYHGQIVVMSQPHIGHTGVNTEDDESQRAWLSGFVVRAASPITSNWRATKSLADDLRERAHDDGRTMRMAAMQLLTTPSAASAAMNGIIALKAKDLKVRSLQEHFKTRP